MCYFPAASPSVTVSGSVAKNILATFHNGARPAITTTSRTVSEFLQQNRRSTLKA
jgi:hypothetical protein